MTEIFLGGQCKQYLSRSFAVANVFIFALPATQPPEEIIMILLLLNSWNWNWMGGFSGAGLRDVECKDGVNSKQGNLV